MSGMKNLALALDELHEAEARALVAGGWTPVEVHGETYWKEPRTAQMHVQDDAIYRLKGNWECKEE